jgi:hypothetical protein
MSHRHAPSTSHHFGRRAVLVLVSLLAAGCGDGHKGDSDSSGNAEHASHGGGGSSESTAAESSSGSTGVTGGVAAPPAAPTDLVASLLEGGVHSTWKDASDNEDNFILEKKADGDADYTLVAELPFDSVTYHDIDVEAGTTYTYRVKAVNAGGESISNEAMIAVP